jgi:hypothetical protein
MTAPREAGDESGRGARTRRQTSISIYDGDAVRVTPAQISNNKPIEITERCGQFFPTEEDASVLECGTKRRILLLKQWRALQQRVSAWWSMVTDNLCSLFTCLTSEPLPPAMSRNATFWPKNHMGKIPVQIAVAGIGQISMQCRY